MSKGGANLVHRKPAFSSDGKFMLVCSSCSIRVLSVATGLLVMELQGHTDEVTSIVVVPFPKTAKSLLTHAWSSSMDGTLRLWNFMSGVQIKCVNVGMPVQSMVIPELCKLSSTNTKKFGLIAFLSVHWKKDAQKVSQRGVGGHVVFQNLATGKRVSIAKVSAPQDLVVSPRGGLIGMTDQRKVWIWRVPTTPIENSGAIKATVLHHVKMLQVVAFDPTETVVACGDESGRMLIWRNVGDLTFSSSKGSSEAYKNSQKRNSIQENGSKSGVRGLDDASVCTTYHWHAHAINTLAFTADGAYLLSGGQEAVLVFWQLDTGKRDFLPRLGAPILHVTSTPDPSLFAVSFADNSIKFINLGNRTVEKNIQGIKPIVLLPKGLLGLHHTTVAIEPQGGRIVFPTANMTLQFYDLLHDRHITEVQVAARNFISRSSGFKEEVTTLTFVSHVTFSGDGLTMATADSRLPEEEMGAASSLKFWRKDANKLHYFMTTLIDEPHSAEISALVYHPKDDMAVSCSPAGEFKTWVQNEHVQSVEGEKTTTGWRCRSVGSYRQKRMLAASFSPDGTLLAVAAEEAITLWNPISNALISVLSFGPSLQPVSMLHFVHDSTYLVSASHGGKPRLLVWNLETLSLWWSYYLNVEAIAVDPNSSCFAVMASSTTRNETDNGEKGPYDSMVSVFLGEHPSPVALWKIRNGSGGALVFMPKKLFLEKVQGDQPVENKISDHAELVILTTSGEFVVFDPHSEDCSSKSIEASKEELKWDEDLSAFAAMYGQASAHKQQEPTKTIAGIDDRKPCGDLLDVPSHVLPPLSKIGHKVIESFLQKSRTQ